MYLYSGSTICIYVNIKIILASVGMRRDSVLAIIILSTLEALLFSIGNCKGLRDASSTPPAVVPITKYYVFLMSA